MKLFRWFLVSALELAGLLLCLSIMGNCVVVALSVAAAILSGVALLGQWVVPPGALSWGAEAALADFPAGILLARSVVTAIAAVAVIMVAEWLEGWVSRALARLESPTHPA